MPQPQQHLFPPMPTPLSPDLVQALYRWRRATLPAPLFSQRFLHSYYLLNLWSLICFLPLRMYVAPSFIPNIPDMEWNTSSRESQLFLILFVLLFTRYKRCNTLETWFTEYLLKYSKVAIICACFVVDMKFALVMLAFYMILLFCGPTLPHYAGPSNVHEIGLDYFKKEIDSKEKAVTMNKKEMTYIVLFYTHDAPNCLTFESEFARASLHYGYPSSSVQFCRINIDAFPSLVQEFQLLTPKMNRFEHELPTVLMFEAGKICARLSELQIGQKVLLNEQNIVIACDLENHARVEPKVLQELEEKLKSKKPAKTVVTKKESKKNK